MTKLKGEYEFMDAPFSRIYFDLLRERARHTPTELAVICGQRQVAYGELESRACKVAAGLRRIGVRRGDRVALLINNRLEWLEIVFGASALGAVVIPLSTWSRHDELKYLLDDAKINVLFALAAFGNQDFAAILDALVPECASTPAGEWRSVQLPYLRAIIGIDAGSHPGWFDYGDFVNEQGISLRRRRAKGQALAMISSFFTPPEPAVGRRRCGSSISPLLRMVLISANGKVYGVVTECFSRLCFGTTRQATLSSPPSAITQR